jgi:hypothetical protein
LWRWLWSNAAINPPAFDSTLAISHTSGAPYYAVRTLPPPLPHSFPCSAAVLCGVVCGALCLRCSQECRKAFQFIEAQEKIKDFGKLTIVASNDLSEEVLWALKEQKHEVDVFGRCQTPNHTTHHITPHHSRFFVLCAVLCCVVCAGIGTNLVTCKSQPALGCVYKLVEVRGQPRIKISQDPAKVTIPGRKECYRLFNTKGEPVLDLLLSMPCPRPFPVLPCFLPLSLRCLSLTRMCCAVLWCVMCSGAVEPAHPSEAHFVPPPVRRQQTLLCHTVQSAASARVCVGRQTHQTVPHITPGTASAAAVRVSPPSHPFGSLRPLLLCSCDSAWWISWE